MIILYFADLICDVSYAIIAVCLFFRKFHLLTASFYTTLIVLLISTFFFSYVTLLIKFTWEFKQMCLCPLIIRVFTYYTCCSTRKIQTRTSFFERSRFVFNF